MHTCTYNGMMLQSTEDHDPPVNWDSVSDIVEVQYRMKTYFKYY